MSPTPLKVLRNAHADIRRSKYRQSYRRRTGCRLRREIASKAPSRTCPSLFLSASHFFHF